MGTTPPISPPATPQRCACAIAVGLAAALLSLTLPLADFDQLWLAGRAIRAGMDPYAAVHGSFWRDLYYPMPAAFIALPATLLPRVAAHACFAGLALGAAAYALSSRGWWALIGLASYPALDATLLAQWSPLFVAAGLVPNLEWIAVAKPTTGLATVLSFAIDRPLRMMWLSLVLGVSIVSACFVLQPQWVSNWLAATRSAAHFKPLVLRPGGVLLLLAAVRWRLPEARLLALLAVIPQTIAPYEALLLTLALRSRREALVFSVASFAALPLLRSVQAGVALDVRINHDAPILLLFLYLPVLVMILRRPNVGRIPRWLERPAAWLPLWLRGTDLAI